MTNLLTYSLMYVNVYVIISAHSDDCCGCTSFKHDKSLTKSRSVCLSFNIVDADKNIVCGVVSIDAT